MCIRDSYVADQCPRLGLGNAKPCKRFLTIPLSLNNDWLAFLGCLGDRHWLAQLYTLSRHDINQQMVQKPIGEDRAEQRIHSLPIVVNIIAVEIRVRIPN